MAKLEHVVSGVSAFIETELFPVMSGRQLWAAAFGMGVLKSQAATIAGNVLQHQAVMMLGLVGEDGDIKVEPAIDAAKSASRKCGKLDVTIPMVGTFRFGEAEFEKIDQYIADAAKQ